MAQVQCADPGHDIEHVKRVVSNTKLLTQSEGGKSEVTIPAAWLHDCVQVSKRSQDRKKASLLASEVAEEYLMEIEYPSYYMDDIKHAILAHSFSADVPPETLEAMIVQDADRLDALGSIGIARTISVGVSLERPLYNVVDPFCDGREPNDSEATLDHFYKKLFVLPTTMKTKSGRMEARRRLEIMEAFVNELKREILLA